MASVSLPAAGQCARHGGHPRRRRLALRCRATGTCSLEEVRAMEKDSWQANVRNLQGRRKHRFWEPVLQDPPPLLDDVCVILVSPKRPISIGTVARSCSSFECEDLRIVEPRCDHMARSGRNASKGAQWLLWRSKHYDSLTAALQDADLSIACTRWVQGRPNSYRSVADLLASPAVAELLAAHEDVIASSSSGSETDTDGGEEFAAAAVGRQQRQQQAEASVDEQQQQQSRQRQGRRGRKLALVFGREVEGLSAAEVEMCDMALSIPIGRLQESLSLSHAVSIVLSRLFELRQQAGSYALPEGVADLAAGYEDTGVER